MDFFEHKMSAKVSRLLQHPQPQTGEGDHLVFIIAVGIVSTVTLVVLRTVVPDVIQLGKDVQIEQLEEGSRKWVINIVSPAGGNSCS